jgi:hypothetical protein
MERSNLVFESAVTDAGGKEYTTRLRELKPDDCKRIIQIVRNYSENATLLLYTAYRENREQAVRNIRENDLDRVLNVFGVLDKHYQGDITILKRFITNFPEADLFSPYGPIQAPFADGVKQYIEKAIQERNKPDRDTIRLGIEIDGNLIGGFVFDFTKKKVEDYITIGDFGVYTENTKTARPGWRYAVYPAIYFIDSVVKGYEDKGENLYISATTHPCNLETSKMFSKERGFREVGGRISTGYGSRRKFVCKYSDFIGNFLVSPKTQNMNHECT